MDENKSFVKEIADIKTNFPQWYTDIVLKTEMVDYGPVKGTMIIRPYGYEIWENIQFELNKRIKNTGHKNAYFPLFIPYNFIAKEAEHVEGFAPEVAMVTHAGGEKLAEPIVVRPTSETLFGTMYSKWIKSWRDLPLLLNQWANVVRWEKTTRPFLRTTEFLWQEGHTAHATKQEAEEETIKMLHVYEEFMKNVLALPVLVGKKSEKEKFAGAETTYSVESITLDGKCLQSGTSHYLGQKFAKAFDIKFLDKDGEHKFVYTTSWGVSTRLIGAMIMAHGDVRGIALPPKVAPIQVVIIPISKKDEVKEKAENIFNSLKDKNIRCELDERNQSPGWKFNEWEMKGVPLRIEIGPRDIEKNCVQIQRRDTLTKEEVKFENIDEYVLNKLDEIQVAMYEKALKHLQSRIKEVHSFDELKEAVNNGFIAKSMWCGSRESEEKVKELTTATSRVMPFDQTPFDDKCVVTGEKAKFVVYFAKAY
ncbi:MAG: proline--tRNA ligase [Clostridia bacterium]|jgi:prolyl-tRNA synthetase|nr:proline--tRNA ligase [Clostridia bacterium]MDD3232372.1 proline--tRNA ligase [Clostridia bacterium]MDD3862547.1 proline--tRNA ligase [Clostridia bacterium]